MTASHDTDRESPPPKPYYWSGTFHTTPLPTVRINILTGSN